MALNHTNRLFSLFSRISAAPLSTNGYVSGNAREPKLCRSPRFLTLAIHIAEGLAQIHAAGVIHKNLTPANLVLNPTTDDLKIIDFDDRYDLKPRDVPVEASSGIGRDVGVSVAGTDRADEPDRGLPHRLLFAGRDVL